jgi:hypothetical protein
MQFRPRLSLISKTALPAAVIAGTLLTGLAPAHAAVAAPQAGSGCTSTIEAEIAGFLADSNEFFSLAIGYTVEGNTRSAQAALKEARAFQQLAHDVSAQAGCG